MNLIEELRWRGMIQDMMPGTEEQLKKEMTTAYIGFDPKQKIFVIEKVELWGI